MSTKCLSKFKFNTSIDWNTVLNQFLDYDLIVPFVASFCKESIVRVKEFLVEYCNKRKTNGYIMLQDPLSSFYEAVCVGLDWEDNTVTDDLIPDLFPDDSGFITAYLVIVFDIAF